MKRQRSRYRQELRRAEQARAGYVDRILGERGPLRRGSFITVRRKCGKLNCRCATGDGHPAHYLSVKESGRTRMVYISGPQAREVAEQAQRYRRFRQARAMLVKLTRQSLAAIDALEQTLERTDEMAGSKTKGQRKAPGNKG